MSGVEFQTGALVFLTAAALLISWVLFQDRSDRRDAAEGAIAGVGHELRITIQRFMAELAAISNGHAAGDGDLMPIKHPQLDTIFSHQIRANRNALSVIGATYLTLEARKLDLKAAFAQGRNPDMETDAAIDAVIDAIVTLYLWEEHKGAKPTEARSTRSWQVRNWMKSHGLRKNTFPNIHLRDEVVERLRQYGMTLTPRPLTHTASEYYAMRYSRKADPHGPFGLRFRPNKAKDGETQTVRFKSDQPVAPADFGEDRATV